MVKQPPLSKTKVLLLYNEVMGEGDFQTTQTSLIYYCSWEFNK